jgi:hypothetical protein
MQLRTHAGLGLMLEEQLRAHGIGARFLLLDLANNMRARNNMHALAKTPRRMCKRAGAAASAVPEAAKLGCGARLGHHRPARARKEVH